MNLIDRAQTRVKRELALQRNHRRVRELMVAIEPSGSPSPSSSTSGQKPVIFFNASTRLSGLSQNAGFSLVSSLALRRAGIPVIHFVCERGLSRCVLGTNKLDPQAPMPCAECVRTSHLIFDGAQTQPFIFRRDEALAAHLESLSLDELLQVEWQDIPLGRLVLPSLRWVLRIHHLQDDDPTRFLAREFLLSAYHVAREFEALIEKSDPRAVVVFNGMFYPEGTARWVAQRRGLPVYSHEVGMLPLSAFFTAEEATAYPVKVDEAFQLNDEQNARLDAYLNQRTQGKFVTAGVQFWPEMRELDDAFWGRAKQFKAVVPVFTNVVFDTSQGHANVVFEHMFAWLDAVLGEIKAHPEVFFVLRAHPDEERPGKESRETVSDWVKARDVEALPNVLFIGPREFMSSYELIAHAKFVMVYNSTVGLESSVLGKPVLCAGKARYTQIPTVFFPQSVNEYRQQLRAFLADEAVEHPAEFQRNARRVLYSQLFRASLPFGDFLEEDGVWKGYVRLKDFDADALDPRNSATLQVVLDGILAGKPFILDL
ncbi:MAG: hypothetical protein PWQ55_231 [Chloroflexota bacterium]|nr:hypothetical protein [Chloroflexota bacterium]